MGTKNEIDWTNFMTEDLDNELLSLITDASINDPDFDYISCETPYGTFEKLYWNKEKVPNNESFKYLIGIPVKDNVEIKILGEVDGIKKSILDYCGPVFTKDGTTIKQSFERDYVFEVDFSPKKNKVEFMRAVSDVKKTANFLYNQLKNKDLIRSY